MKRSMQAHATEEAKALKRGGASPRLMAEERAKYAKKGVKFADGGAVKYADGGHVKARQTTKSHGKSCK